MEYWVRFPKTNLEKNWRASNFTSNTSVDQICIKQELLTYLNRTSLTVCRAFKTRPLAVKVAHIQAEKCVTQKSISFPWAYVLETWTSPLPPLPKIFQWDFTHLHLSLPFEWCLFGLVIFKVMRNFCWSCLERQTWVHLIKSQLCPRMEATKWHLAVPIGSSTVLPF